jgi:hypothetical protein
MKFMELKDIVVKLMCLNKAIRQEIKGENYLLFKKFIQYFTLNKRLTRSDMIVNNDVLSLIERNVKTSKEIKPVDLKPFVFFTDGGVYQDNF